MDGKDCYWWGSFPFWSELSCWFMHSESRPEQETSAEQRAVPTTSNGPQASSSSQIVTVMRYGSGSRP